MKSFKQYLQEALVAKQYTQMGSNEGGVYHDDETGEKHYIKFPETDEQAHVEVAAAKLYHHVGLKTLNPEIHKMNGRTAVKTVWDDNVERSSPQQIHKDIEDPARAHTVALAHHMAVITNNRDVVGLEYDNLLKHKKTGGYVSADQGASFHFRAMGERKDFDDDIEPLTTGFKNTQYQSGKVFSKLPEHAMKSAASAIKQSLTDDHIDHIMGSHGLGRFADTVKARRDKLLSQYS